jgi:hypothetical protein
MVFGVLMPRRDSEHVQPVHLLLVGVHDLLQRDAELHAYRLELLEVFCVLALVLDLEFDTCDVG